LLPRRRGGILAETHPAKTEPETKREEPAMKFKRVEHVAIAVKSMEKMRDIFENKLGIEMEYEEDLPHYNTKLAMYPIGETYLEVLESSSPDTETSKWIEEHGEGLFHICLEVDDIDGALVELKGKGVKLIDETPRIGHGGARIAFLHPEAAGNLLIELAEIPADGHH
jgi:methylmalonyl-CoA epimerase